ncbi:ATP-dependent helicase [Lachnospiraceae bacterium 62-35]
MPFNQPQRQAISHKDGPMMVLAGPGSGKTTVITHRIRYLIQEHRVNPGNILVITFTRAAAMEMKARFETLMGEERVHVSFGTFHSIFFTILRYAYRYEAGDIIRDEERNRILKELIREYGIETEDEAEFISSILGEIGMVKGGMIKLEHYYSKNCPEAVFKKLYEGYEKQLRRDRKIDFDDMLVMCYELFSQRKDILSVWQKKYQYILIDEFQDINRIQYQVIQMLALPENNLFIVGDDDQSIYRFRGAKPEIMLGFERDYPSARRVLLNINYRSTRNIVKAAGRLICFNQERFHKEILSSQGEGKPVDTRVCTDTKEEVLRIIQYIFDYVKAGYRLSDMAVLYRTSLEPRFLVEKLMEYNVPFAMRDSLPNLYEHWISRNILSYIQVALGNRERSKIMEIMNRPKRYISREALESPHVSFEKIKSFYQDKGWMVERVEQLEYDLDMIRKMAPVAAVNYIRKAIGYNDYLREYADFRRMKEEDLLETADQIQESASGFQTFEDWFSHIENYKKELQEQAHSQDRTRKEEGEAVALMTMHSSKGLEYRIVFILDANEGITPHRKAVLDADLEEERRMFYVAMTRAKERLHVFCVKERYGKKQDISRFIGEYREPAEPE